LTRAPALLLVAWFAAPCAAQTQMFALSGNTSPILRRLDPATGAILESHVVTGQEALFGGLACDAAGVLYSIDGYNDPNSDRTFRIDRATGAGSVVGPTGYNWNFRTLHAHPGQATFIATISAPGLNQLTALAVRADGAAFITDIAGVNLYSLNLTTGQATLLGSLGGPNNWYNDLAFDPSGVLYGARLNGGVYTINTAAVQETFAFGGNYTGLTFFAGTSCYPNCDGSTAPPVLNVADFSCFLQKFAASDPYANCDGSTTVPVLNVADFSCFLQRFAAGCP
jgi:hypothetical protein